MIFKIFLAGEHRTKSILGAVGSTRSLKEWLDQEDLRDGDRILLEVEM